MPVVCGELVDLCHLTSALSNVSKPLLTRSQLFMTATPYKSNDSSHDGVTALLRRLAHDIRP